MQDRDELQKALAKIKQLSLQYALEREQWSSSLRQQHSELYAVEIEQLKHQLEQTKAERDAARRTIGALARLRRSSLNEVETLKSSLDLATSRLQQVQEQEDHASAVADASDGAARAQPVHGSFLRAAAAAVSVFVVAALFTTVVYDDAQSNVTNDAQQTVAAVNALEAVQVSTGAAKTEEKKPPPQSGKRKTRFAGAKPASQRQWGPALLMPDPDEIKPRVVFDPQIRQLQANLLTLGFDLGEADGFNGLRTRQAIDEFRALYLPDDTRQLPASSLVLITGNYANLARNDALRFGMDQGVVAAIRLSSVRTGVDFSYLMKLAATESNFKPAVKSETSSATGIYQFTRDTWLNALKRHGARYGLVDYADRIEYQVTRGGYRRPMVRDEVLYQHLLELRKNPRISAMMAAESVRDNRRKLVHRFDRKPAQTDLYLTHFLGADGAITFLKALEQNPDTFAVDIFPEAARSNRGIFHPKTCAPRTVDEVYELFGEKFDTDRYDDIAAN